MDRRSDGIRPARPRARTLAHVRCPAIAIDAGAPRNAANPLNAILNYLYTLLEVETRIALIASGARSRACALPCRRANRQSLAADVMEPVRPHVDAFVLNLARTRTFSEGLC